MSQTNTQWLDNKKKTKQKEFSSSFSNCCSLAFFFSITSLHLKKKRFSLIRSLTSLKRFFMSPYSVPNILHFSVALLHSECSSLLFITLLSLHIFFRTFVHFLLDAPASHSFSSRLTFFVLRALLSSTCSYSSGCSTTKETTHHLYARVK